MAYDEQTAKLIRENERLRRSLYELVEVLEKRLNDPWIETLHKVQEAKVLLGIEGDAMTSFLGERADHGK